LAKFSPVYSDHSEWTVQFYNDGTIWPTAFRLKAIIPENNKVISKKSLAVEHINGEDVACDGYKVFLFP